MEQIYSQVESFQRSSQVSLKSRKLRLESSLPPLLNTLTGLTMRQGTTFKQSTNGNMTQQTREHKEKIT